MLILNNAELNSLLPAADVIKAVEAAMRAHEEGEALAPLRQHLEWGENTLLTMPACDRDGVGVKLVSVVPGNTARALPVTNGAMVLIDSTTGIPTALLSAASLTAQRTGAVGAVALKYMARAHLASVGIVGTGVQGTWQAIFAAAVLPIKTIFFVARSTHAASSFSTQVSAHLPRVTLERCKGVRELLTRTEVIIVATTSAEPVLPDEPSLLMNKHFISIGSFKPSMQELPDAVYRLAGTLVIDSEQARAEVGDVINPIARGILSPQNVFHIGALVARRRVLDVERTTAFKSVGMALYDLYVARAFFAAAQRKEIGVAVTL